MVVTLWPRAARARAQRHPKGYRDVKRHMDISVAVRICLLSDAAIPFGVLPEAPRSASGPASPSWQPPAGRGGHRVGG